MNKIILSAIAMFFLATLFISSCKKSDTGDGTVPEIVIKGLNPLYWAKDYVYVDEGAIAYDVTPAGDTVDLTESIVVTSDVNVYSIGEYMVKYNVEDESGVKAEEKIRVVKVVLGK